MFSLTLRYGLLSAAIFGCSPSSESGTTTTSTVTTTAVTTTTTTTTTTTQTTPTDTQSTTIDTGLESTFDCATIPRKDLPLTVFAGTLAGRGLAFDDSGRVVGVSEPHLMTATYQGTPSVFVPSLGELDQIDIMPDGDFVLSNFGTGSLLRVTPEGVTSVIVSGIGAYGVRVGPDGMVYTANGNVIHRIDPASKTKVTWLVPSGFRPRVLDFSPDLTRMYIGTNDSNGTLWTVELDAELNPVGDPSLWNSGLGGWHDGLGVDICGNVYLADYDTLSLYRISPDGATVETLVDGDASPAMYGHGLVWGSGIKGWKENALYLPQPINGDTLAELEIEVPYRTWQGTVINRQ